jgi:hypothetical protein
MNTVMKLPLAWSKVMRTRDLIVGAFLAATALNVSAKVDGDREVVSERPRAFVEWHLESSASPGDTLEGELRFAQPVAYDAVQLSAFGGEVSELSRKLNTSGSVVSIAFVFSAGVDAAAHGMVSVAIHQGEGRKPLLGARRVEISGVEDLAVISGDIVLLPVAVSASNRP